MSQNPECAAVMRSASKLHVNQKVKGLQELPRNVLKPLRRDYH